ncbi:M23 family metallopeptidase [Limisalsivibrio acetivorans]|uniref:M23 family metallopeptidase n=1 Tax=Limisalsivibrio acetivorans TaxID=1304888 RepID=UPI0003B378BB|nr:M23 family metallopeptidase [Limisalsivibrio acetivorans]
MKRKYTIMIFDESRMGAVKTRKISLGSIKLILMLLGIYVLISGAGFYFLNDLYSERSEMLAFKKENEQLKDKITGYASQLDDIKRKIASVDELEYKVRNLATYSGGAEGTKQLAIGGKEVDIIQDLSAVSERKEKEFFEELNETLVDLGVEIEKRSASLSELANFLEENRLIMSSTPSIWPTKGWISSGFGYRRSPFTGRRVFHEAIDIATKTGTPIKAGAKGVVIFSGRKAGYGKVLIIDHGFGYVTKYAHCNKLYLKEGESVEKGQVVAEVGNTGRSTGPHLHYEVLVNGVPVNPMKFIISESEFN